MAWAQIWQILCTPLWWVDHSQQLSPHPASCLFPTSGEGEVIKRAEARKKAEVKDNLRLVEIKTVWVEKKRCKTDHVPPAGWGPASAWAVAVLEKLSQLYCWAWRYMAWTIPLLSLGQLSPPCPLLTCSLWGSGSQKASVLRVHGPAAAETSVLATQLWSPIWNSALQAAVKKISSLPANPTPTSPEQAAFPEIGSHCFA